MNILGDFIQTKRKEKDLSLRDLARLCGLSHSYIDGLEKGQDTKTGKPISPTVDTLAKIAKGLGVPILKMLEVAAESLSEKYDDDEKVFEARLTAGMEEEYGKKPSPEFVAFAKAMRREILEDIRKEKQDKSVSNNGENA